ncbi:MAG: glycosyltransferase family 1 protein, partial [Bacteroidota bacterium]
KEVVKDGYNGFLCNEKDAKSLTNKIKRYLSLNSVEKSEMGANSRKLVQEKFDEQTVIDTYVDVIHRIINIS